MPVVGGGHRSQRAELDHPENGRRAWSDEGALPSRPLYRLSYGIAEFYQQNGRCFCTPKPVFFDLKRECIDIMY